MSQPIASANNSFSLFWSRLFSLFWSRLFSLFFLPILIKTFLPILIKTFCKGINAMWNAFNLVWDLNSIRSAHFNKANLYTTHTHTHHTHTHTHIYIYIYIYIYCLKIVFHFHDRSILHIQALQMEFKWSLVTFFPLNAGDTFNVIIVLWSILFCLRECGVLLHCQCSHVHSNPEWYHLIGH